MTDFFIEQLDFITFIYGLALALLAVVGFIMTRHREQRLPWFWLSLFGLIHGLRELVSLLGPVSGDPLPVRAVAMVLFDISFIPLVEFCRSGSRMQSGRRIPVWVYAALLLIPVAGMHSGMAGVELASRFILGLPCGLWTSWVLSGASRSEEGATRRWLILAAAAFGIYAAAEGMVMSGGGGLPAYVITEERFLEITGFPVQLLKAVAAMLATLSLWLYSQRVLSGADPLADQGSLLRPRPVRPAAMIIGIVAAGWALTVIVGDHARQRELKEGMLYLGEFTNFLRDEMEELAHQAQERASAPILVSAMKSGSTAAVSKADAILDRTDMMSHSCRLRDVHGRVLAGCVHNNENEPETSAAGKEYFAEAIATGKPSGYFGVDEDTMERSYFVNASITDGSRGILGVMTLRTRLDDVEGRLRSHGNCFLVDPNGVVFLSGRRDMILKALWPITDETKHRLNASGQFGHGLFSPVLKKEPYVGSYVYLEGRRYLASREYLNRDGWSMVLLREDSMIRIYRLFAIFSTAVLCGLVIASLASGYLARDSAARISASERRYRGLVEESPIGVVLLDKEGRCLTINRAGMEMLRFGESDVVGGRLEQVRPLPPAGSIGEMISRVCGGSGRSFEAEVVRTRGDRTVLHVTLTPITGLYGAVNSIMGIFMDITDRVRAEQELQRYQRQLEELVKDRTLELTEINQRLQLEIGERQRTEAELSRHRDHLEELANERTADLTIANEFLQMEITERRKAEEELRAFSGRIETIINASADVITMKDRALRYAIVNDAFVRFLGRPVREIVGRTDFEVMPLAAAEACLRSDEAALLTEGPHESEEEVGGRWFHVFKQRVRDTEGNVSGVVAVIRDITDRKKAEKYLRQHQAHLEAEVQRRTAELMQANELLTAEIEERKLVETNLERALAGAGAEKEKTEAIIAALGDGIVIQDTDYRIIYQNRLQLERYGDHIGEFCFKAYHGLEAVCENCPVEMSFRDGQVHKAEVPGRGSGGEIYVELTSSPLRDASGNIIAGIKMIRDITERRRSEENLRLFSMAIEEAMDGVQIVDLGGRIVYSNKAVEEIYGYTDSELAGRHVNELNADPTFADEFILPGIRESGRWNGELMVRHKEGRLLPVWLSASIVKDGNGAPLAMVGIIRDFTKRKELEAALREVSSRQEAILNNIPDLAWLKDIDGRFIAVNEPFGRLCGEKPDDIRGKTDRDIWPPELAKRYIDDDLDVIRSGRRKCVEEPIADSDGKELWIETIKTPIFNDQGAVVGTIGIARDITERRLAREELQLHRENLMGLVEERTFELKHAVDRLTAEINIRKGAEETLRQSEARYRRLSQEFHTLLDAIPDVLLLLSPDLKVLWANRGAASEFHRDVEELIGRKCYSLWHGRTEPCPDCHAVLSFSSGEALNSRRTDARGRILDSRVFPIRDEAGMVRNAILVVSDITEKTSLQAEAMRASHLASLGELAAGVAHEINNPINGIINYAQILLNRSGGGAEADIYERIIREGDRIANIVRSLLSFARERRDEMVLVDLRKILHDTLILTEAQINKDGIHLFMSVSEDLPSVMANPQQIQQVFLNLISNARYALNQKYPVVDDRKRLAIAAEKAPAGGDAAIRVVFEDQGVGIPDDIADRVMNPFFSTKPAGQGTGLGLSISHGIIKNHGGKITIESKAGQFTRVIVDLPVWGKNGQ